MTRALIYSRVSTEMQEEKDSLKYQIEKCRDYCKFHSFTVVKEISDVDSGGKDNRKGFLELQNEVDLKTFDVLVVYESSRVSRTMLTMIKFVLKLQEKDIKFISISQPELNTTTPNGMLFFQIQSSLAEYERKQIASRVRSSNHQRAKSGSWLGGSVPIGYDNVDKQLVVNEREADIVRSMFECYLTYGTIAKVAKLFGRHHQSVRWILTNEVYIGKKKWGQKERNIMTGKVKINSEYELYDGKHEAIISEEVFEAAQAIINVNKNKKLANSSSQAIFTGILRCTCGGKTHNSSSSREWKTQKRVTSHHYYKCTECKKNYPREEVEKSLFEQIYSLPEMRELNDHNLDLKSINMRIENLRKTLKKLESKRKRLMKIYTNGLIEEDELKDLLEEVTLQSSETNKEIRDNLKIIEDEEVSRLNNENIETFKRVMANLDIGDRTEAKKIIRLLFNKIEIVDFKKKKYNFYLNF